MFDSFIKEIKKRLYLLRSSTGLLKRNTICVIKVRLIPKASKGSKYTGQVSMKINQTKF